MSSSLPLRELVHEMRNELAVARANLEGLADGKFAPTRERLLSIIQALTQLESLIGDIQSRESDASMPVRLACIDVCHLLDREFRSVEPVARARGVTVSIERCPTPAAECLDFYGDAIRIGQIVKNVLLNAIRYAPKGGSVSVDCKRRADQLEIRIGDDGPGIPAAERDHVFNAGFRGEASAGTNGSGIGLAVVKQLVEAQGGSVSVSDAAPHGASFVVRLPGTIGSDSHVCAKCRESHDSKAPDRTTA